MNNLSTVIEMQQQQIDAQHAQISYMSNIILIMFIAGCGLILVILCLILYRKDQLKEEEV
ncbi:hypothetical protein [Sphingobacterium sp.]|uniref:hypothetical protein n=1 Tax=Sphingobacterium sp. TaxID=341027 RepID=UPI0028A10A73|nr:hypothetical protein [Sphingobacterium sp.]